MKILITGGAGFIGAHLINKLENLGHKVLNVDNLSTIGGIIYISKNSDFIKGDITNINILKKIEQWKPEIIYHLAAQSGGETSYDNPRTDYLTNGYGTYLLCNLAKKLKIKKFIYTSSVAVYGSNLKKINEKSNIDPDSLYGISKYAGEMFINQILKSTKTQTIIFRLFNTYGPGENLNFLKKGMVKIYCSYLWRKKPIIVKGSLKRFRNYQYIDDVISLLVLSLDNKKLKKNEIINLTSGRSTTVQSLLKLIFKVNNLKKYKVIKSAPTPGDSFGFHSSNQFLKSKFTNFKFTSLQKGLEMYFQWIKKIPNTNNLKNYHPLNLKK